MPCCVAIGGLSALCCCCLRLRLHPCRLSRECSSLAKTGQLSCTQHRLVKLGTTPRMSLGPNSNKTRQTQEKHKRNTRKATLWIWNSASCSTANSNHKQSVHALFLLLALGPIRKQSGLPEAAYSFCRHKQPRYRTINVVDCCVVVELELALFKTRAVARLCLYHVFFCMFCFVRYLRVAVFAFCALTQ